MLIPPAIVTVYFAGTMKDVVLRSVVFLHQNIALVGETVGAHRAHHAGLGTTRGDFELLYAILGREPLDVIERDRVLHDLLRHAHPTGNRDGVFADSTEKISSAIRFQLLDVPTYDV
jgi:hypothetical protein